MRNDASGTNDQATNISSSIWSSVLFWFHSGTKAQMETDAKKTIRDRSPVDMARICLGSVNCDCMGHTSLSRPHRVSWCLKTWPALLI